jgi:hypothetical protein
MKPAEEPSKRRPRRKNLRQTGAGENLAPKNLPGRGTGGQTRHRPHRDRLPNPRASGSSGDIIDSATGSDRPAVAAAAVASPAELVASGRDRRPAADLKGRRT